MTEPRTPTTATGRLLQVAADIVRATGVCEKPHRNGEANPHIHFNDAYIARGRDIAFWTKRLEAEAVAVERARIRAAVEGLDSLAGWVTWDVDLHPNDERYINRAVVLALLDPQP